MELSSETMTAKICLKPQIPYYHLLIQWLQEATYPLHTPLYITSHTSFVHLA